MPSTRARADCGCPVASAGFYLPGCCVGAAEVLDVFCPRETANNLDRVRVIVAYIEARPNEWRKVSGF
jgi:hypothetical protein